MPILYQEPLRINPDESTGASALGSDTRPSFNGASSSASGASGSMPSDLGTSESDDDGFLDGIFDESEIALGASPPLPLSETTPTSDFDGFL